MKQCCLVARVVAIALAAALLPASASTQAPAYITQWGTYGTGDGQLNLPFGIAVVASGNVYVTEYGNNRIQVFGSPPEPTKSTTCGRVKALYR